MVWSKKKQVNTSCPNPGRREEIKLNFNFHFSLWCLKRFEGLKGLHKTFWGTTKKCENKNLIVISIELSEMHGTLRVNIGFCKLSLQLKYFETMLGVLGKTINNCNFCDRCLLYDFFFSRLFFIYKSTLVHVKLCIVCNSWFGHSQISVPKINVPML